MQTRDWNRIRELFDRALQRGPEDRLDLLRKLSSDNVWLAKEVEALLTINQPPDREVLPATHRTAAVRQLIPTTFNVDIGPYRIVKAVRHSETGTVYLAWQRNFGESVLIRIIRPDYVRPNFSRRISELCRILSDLNHPSIARVLDGGITGAGFPYVVTEDISGEPLDRYCDRRDLSIRGRLQLFARICRTVECLHLRSVVHRDLRPGNILVARDGTARVLGAGIDSLLGPRPIWPIGKALLWRTTGPGPGSLERDTVSEASVANDVYALGAILYELLCGHRPDTPDPMRGVPTGAQPQKHPEPPSSMMTRRVVIEVKNTSVLVTPERVCRSRGCSFNELRSQVRGNLDWIALKALRKNAAERYQSAAKLAEDIERHLVDSPVPGVPARLFSRVRSLLPL